MLNILPAPGRDTVLSAAREVKYGRRDLIFTQGDPSNSLLIIETGCVAIRLIGAGGESVILGLMGPGDVVGEMGLLMPGRNRTATVQALDDVQARSLDRDTFERLRLRHPSVNDFFIHILAARADTLSQRVVEAHHFPVERRVARFFFYVWGFFEL